MFKAKATITALIMVAVALFVLVAVSSVFFGTNDAYRELSQSQAQQAAPAEEAERFADDALEQLMAEQQQALESAVEEAAVESATDVVEQAAEAAVQSTEDVVDIAQAAIDAAAQQAAQGREQADQLVEMLTAATEAQTHVVTAEALVFNPVVITIQPGDTVSWVNMPTHDTQSLEGLIPEGAEHWHSEMSQNYSRTFTQEGIYVYKCTPHFGSAMGGAVIVGNPVNIEEIRNAGARGAAGRLVRQALAVADTM